jgi:hypothetical protein
VAHDLALVWATVEPIGRGLVAALMATAGVLKLGDDGFAATISEIARLAPRRARVLARVLPPVEIAAGLGLLLSPVSQLASALCAVLIGGYATAMVVNLAGGRRDLRCACFGGRTNDVISWGTVRRNVLLLIALAPALLPNGLVRVNDEPVLSAGESAVLLIGAAGCTLMVLVLRYLGELPQRGRRTEAAQSEKEMR